MAVVIVDAEALAQLDELPDNIVGRMERVFERLRRWPDVSGAKPLRGSLAGRWRIRTGDYRVQFFIERGRPASEGRPAEPVNVVVEKVGHRDGFYDEHD